MENDEHQHECCKETKFDKGGLKNYLVVGMVALILAITIFQSFQINAMKNNQVVNEGSTNANGKLDMSGWTENEKMMYDHHGTLPSRLQKNAPQQSEMVGGC